MSAGKLTNIEERAMKERGDPNDSSRALSNYLQSWGPNSNIHYLIEGVRREAETWVQTRRLRHDLDEIQFEDRWDNIRRTGFQHVYSWCQELVTKATALGHLSDARDLAQLEGKFREVFNQASEIGQLHTY